MNDINLIRYHNRSSSEINMLLAGETADKLFSRVVLGESKKGAGSSMLVLFGTVAASFACAVFASYVIYHVVLVKDISLPAIDKTKIAKKVSDYKLELRTGGDPYLKDGFQKIAEVEKTPDANAQPVVVVSGYKPPVDKEANPELFTKPVELQGEPKKRKRDKRMLVTPIFTGNHVIQFLDVNEKEAAKVRVLAENNDFNLEIIGSSKKAFRKWKAYREDRSSSVVIAGMNVKYMKTFKSRQAALDYLEEKRIAGIVATDTTYYDYYDMEVCCLGDEAAEKLARGSGIAMKKIKILKK
ncbi:hypothetical protein Dacet_1203 [Denitrovibrio acetiphilus DSM 12809]|uniref:Uncharacterized protein n=1 Tax=Denitrovibrio acetiphilus (strain DSM 12809 / NBRC 114555 / N2460) TaxID=522772 RepID=D4H7H6_DENA2|nr:hypothetical protein [Denitrovibrio acetiphilus]ADD67975.1 hypothetical protein Dacet_1203 [Denitrovibrio acetiphilus DSM 12809]